MNIGRTLFWFKDGNESLIDLDERFFSLATLLNRLMNEVYNGKKIEFINIDLSTQKTYDLYPILPKGREYFYGKQLKFYGTIDLAEFVKFSDEKQRHFIWQLAFEYLQLAAKALNNKELTQASEYAFFKGLDLDLDPDFKVVETSSFIGGRSLNFAIWINFRKEGMYSNLIVEKDGERIFQRELDKTKNGIEFFLEMYKSIQVDENMIIVKGRKDVSYLPLRIPMNEVIR